MFEHLPQLRRPRGIASRWLAGAASAVLLALVAPQLAFGQGVDITGRVIDAEVSEPLNGAEVELLTGTGRVVHSTVTDVRGEFRLVAVEAGTYSLLVTALGYELHRIDRVGVGAVTVVLDPIELISRAFRLNPVVVTASRGQEKALEAPASVYTVSTEEIQAQPTTVAAEHVVGLPGVDNVTYGLQQHNVVARGFNNVFSGALYILQDNRWASVPSLRFNAYNLIPSTDEDIDRIEMVLGPGSALYGPNVDKGVMHIITRSPLDYQGSAISVLAGAREGNDVGTSTEPMFQGVFRTAGLIGDDTGYKLSGLYLNGEDWHYTDPVEQFEREAAIAAGADPDTLKIGLRDFSAKRFAGDARMDFRLSDENVLRFAGGLSNMGSSIEMTGIGSAQAVNWTYWYLQGRAQLGRLFAQAYINMSNAGDTYTLRDGKPIVDNSLLFAGQLQHFSSLGERNRFVYGLDYIQTVPRTDGSVNGRNEDNDNISEVGGYMQWESALSPMWDLLAAARVDYHSKTEQLVFSPRAGVVFKPTQDHNFRLMYNRAFAQPSSINFSLDLLSANALGPFVDYGVRALGVPANTGLTFRRDCLGDLCIRSPFAADPNQFQGLDVTPYWDNAVDGLTQILAALGEDPLPPPVEGLLRSLSPTSDDVSTALRMFDQQSRGFGPIIDDPAQAAVDVPKLKPSTTNIFEVGYKGLLGERLLFGADVYYMKIEDFIGPLRFETPNAMLDPQSLGQYLLPILQGAGVPLENALLITGALAQVPLGTATWVETPTGSPTDLYLTYRNFGDVDLWGADFGLTFLLTDIWSLSGSYSWVSEDLFIGLGNAQVDSIGDIALNAPMNKATLGVLYDNQRLGLSVGLKGRYVQGYPVQSGVFVGDIPGFTVLDANIGYTLPVSTRTELVFDFRNFFSCTGESTEDPNVASGCAFGRTHQEIIGAPFIGSVISLRVRQPF
jgi:iron complex outermembrane receptor protein